MSSVPARQLRRANLLATSTQLCGGDKKDGLISRATGNSGGCNGTPLLRLHKSKNLPTQRQAKNFMFKVGNTNQTCPKTS